MIIKTVQEICPEIIHNSHSKETVKQLMEKSLKYAEENNLNFMQFVPPVYLVFTSKN